MSTLRTRIADRNARGERGAVLVLAAVMMTMLMAFSAIALDISNARQHHRQARGSADAAALAAAQDLPNPSKVVATAKEYAAQNFDTPASAWAGCSDPDHLSETPDLGNSNTCISVDAAFSRVRVRVPERQVETYFAKVMGVDEVGVSAAAVAEAKLKRDDRIIPATVAASTGTGNTCIEMGGSSVAPCDKSVSGNFGSFNAPRLNLYKPTSQVENNALRINYSMGVDHVLSIYGSGTRVCDFDHPVKSPCTTTNVASGQDANHLLPFTGNVVPPLTDGLVENATISTDDGSKLFCGRLRRPDLTDANLAETAPEGCEHWKNGPTSGPAITVTGERINGRHAAYWMKPEFRTLFYGNGINPMTTPSTSTAWAAGDNRLDCFMSSYRFDYGGSNSKGHAPQTEFFIDPNSTLDSNTADGTEFTLAQARTYLKTTCGLDPVTVDQKLASLTDGHTFWPMFDKGIIADPRFGMIPVVKQFNSGGSTPMQIVRFWGIYMYRLHANNTKVHAVDSWTFEPALIETESGVADLQFGFQTKQPIVRLVE